MNKSRKRRLNRGVFWTLIALGSLVLILSGLVTVSEQLDRPFLPTWNRIFEAVGLRETPPLSDLENELRIDVIDVGNADSILIRSGTSSMLIDAGTNPAGDVYKRQGWGRSRRSRSPAAFGRGSRFRP